MMLCTNIKCFSLFPHSKPSLSKVAVVPGEHHKDSTEPVLGFSVYSRVVVYAIIMILTSHYELKYGKM